MDVCGGDLVQYEVLRKAPLSTFFIKFENYVTPLKSTN